MAKLVDASDLESGEEILESSNLSTRKKKNEIIKNLIRCEELIIIYL